jgi:hypothetical protein
MGCMATVLTFVRSAAKYIDDVSIMLPDPCWHITQRVVIKCGAVITLDPCNPILIDLRG